jgi:ribosomal protein L14E/L6E/L27E
MAVRNQVRDSRGRFAGGGGGGVISRPKPPRPQPKGGSMTRALRRGQRDLYKAEQMRVQSMGGDVAGMRIIRRNIKKGANAKTTASSKQGKGSGKVSDALRGTLRQLAQSDARYFRELNNIVNQPANSARRVTGTRKSSQKRLKGA